MELKEMISKRKSVRKYTGVPVDAATLQDIRSFGTTVKPLYPDIKLHWQIVETEQVRFYLPWKSPQLIAVYSEKKEGYLENVGFLYQQMDLYLQSIGLGSCWLGLGKMRGEDLAVTEQGLEFVILLAFGHTEDALRSGPADFKREPMIKIADREDAALEPARLAPSSTNSQPWYFTHEGNVIRAFCSTGGILKHKTLGVMNRIDMGIALAHMYVSAPESFRFFREEAVGCSNGYRYTGSFSLDG